MPPISSLLSTRSGSSGSERAKDSRRRVRAAARVAPSIAFLRCISTSRRGPFRRRWREIDAADHHRQHVVEVVGDAAGQLADRLHLLDLAQLGLGGLALLRLGLQCLVRLPQFLGPLADRLFERLGALGLAFGLPAGGAFWRSAWTATTPRKMAPSADEDPEPAQIIGELVGLRPAKNWLCPDAAVVATWRSPAMISLSLLSSFLPVAFVFLRRVEIADSALALARQSGAGGERRVRRRALCKAP